MALKYGDINAFVLEHKEEVTAYPKEGHGVTILRNGKIDSITFFEKDAATFRFKGKKYSREEFEKLVSGD